MKRYLFTTLLLLSCKICFASMQPTEKNGQLRVEGMHIVNQYGQKVMLRGVSLGWHNWWPQFYNASVIETLRNDWDISVVRIAMGVEPEGAYLDNPEKAMATIKPVIDAALTKGLYVIIDWHSHKIYTEQAEEFFLIMAQRYAGCPNIIYEIFNEPEGLKWEEIKEYSVRIIEAIRRYDKYNLIIVGTPNWSQDVDIVAKDPINGYSNVVYSLHFYAASHDQIKPKAQYAAEQGLPMFVSECSPSFANGDGKLNKKAFSGWLDFLKQNNISFVMWGLYDKNESSAMLKPGASADGNWSFNQLTEMGVYSRKIMRDRGWFDMDPYRLAIIGTILVSIIAFTFIRKNR